MWSEHCSYKHSKHTLKKLPTKGKHVLQGPGENAGIVDIGDGLAIALKIESHNHPSAIEPYQGAATGVGGIVRDIFAMGARPIAILDSLRFGKLDDPRQGYLFEGVVSGIAGYGNCLGIPTVGGEVYFESSYSENCLVNAMCVGIVEINKIIKAAGSGPGNLVVLIGSKTGRDGIGGASILASQEFDETSEQKRPSVQVGDPFTEKLLIEACLELQDKRLLVALQDLGAAGLTSSLSEVASRGEVGLDIDVSKVPLREPGMTAWEIMVSESQERMAAIVKPELLPNVLAVCEKWGLDATVIGKITDSKALRVFAGGELVADIPAYALADKAPTYIPESKFPNYLKKVQGAKLPDSTLEIKDELLLLLSSLNIASKSWVYKQYDHQVGLNSTVLPGSDAAVLRIKGTNKSIALTTDGNGRYCYLDPYAGGMIAVAEAARNLACAGATPIAVTDCLNFGNPEKPGIFYQFENAVQGIADFCDYLEIPVVSGNVSFYNESSGKAIFPTPVIGMLGLIDSPAPVAEAGFKNEGDELILVGETLDGLEGTEYANHILDSVCGRPPKIEAAVHKKNSDFILSLIKDNLLSSVHDLSDGGLWIAFIECCLKNGFGASLRVDSFDNARKALFSESQSRYLISLNKNSLDAVKSLADKNGVYIKSVGQVGKIKGAIEVAPVGSFEYVTVSDLYNNSIHNLMEEHGSR
jgi:phosphoribosylformylglycinamidine synthase